MSEKDCTTPNEFQIDESIQLIEAFFPLPPTLADEEHDVLIAVAASRPTALD